MTDSQLLEGAHVGRRARLQRLTRRQRTHAARDAFVGAVVSALLVLGLNAWYLHEDATARQRIAEVAAAEGAAGDAVASSETGSAGAPAVMAARTQASRFSAVMVGDLMFGRHVERVAERRGYAALLTHVDRYLDADYVSGNLEQVVSERDDLPEADKLIHLKSDPEPLDALVDAGFTLVTLANNHTMDHGVPGVVDTVAAVEAAGLDHVGAGEDLDDAAEIHYEEHAGIIVATLSFTDAYVEGFIARAFQGGALDADPDTSVRLIQAAAAQADLVIAQFHWGDEYDFAPNRRQRELAEVAVAAGADLVIGHHPHVLMPVERMGTSIVAYSLGNFVFDQGWTRTRESAIFRYDLGDDGTARISLRPVWIREATPRPLDDSWRSAYRRARIFQELRGDELDWRVEDGVLVTDVDHSHVLGADR